ncbi:hypothetical protein [Methylobacterium oryzae]
MPFGTPGLVIVDRLAGWGFVIEPIGEPIDAPQDAAAVIGATIIA